MPDANKDYDLRDTQKYAQTHKLGLWKNKLASTP